MRYCVVKGLIGFRWDVLRIFWASGFLVMSQ